MPEQPFLTKTSEHSDIVDRMENCSHPRNGSIMQKGIGRSDADRTCNAYFNYGFNEEIKAFNNCKDSDKVLKNQYTVQEVLHSNGMNLTGKQKYQTVVMPASDMLNESFGSSTSKQNPLYVAENVMYEAIAKPHQKVDINSAMQNGNKNNSNGSTVLDNLNVPKKDITKVNGRISQNGDKVQKNPKKSKKDKVR